MKKQFFKGAALTILCIVTLFLFGCVGEEPPVGATPPDALEFNGVSYPLDAEVLSVGPYGTEQLAWSTNLHELTYTGAAPESWDFLSSLSHLEYLSIYISADESHDLLLGDYELPALQTLEVICDGALGSLSLPKTATEAACFVQLDGVERLDASASTLGVLTLSLSAAPTELTLGSGLHELTCDGFAPDLAALGEAAVLETLRLTVVQDLAPLPAGVKNLTLSGSEWVLSALKQSSVEMLAAQQCTSAELQQLAGAAALHTLQISDAYTSDLDFAAGLPKLRQIYILVDEMQSHPEYLITQITAENAEALEGMSTALPQDQLSDFLADGGTLVFVPEYNRAIS